MLKPRSPLLYQINTRAWLRQLSGELGRPVTLDDIPDRAWADLAKAGFDWIWLLGVWQTGAAGRRVSRENPEWRHEYEATLPDLTDEDIPGSCFAITGYHGTRRTRRRRGVGAAAGTHAAAWPAAAARLRPQPHGAGSSMDQ